jgi:hypothetical protein
VAGSIDDQIISAATAEKNLGGVDGHWSQISAG